MRNLVSLAVLFLASVAVADPNIKDGQWAIEIKMEVPGVPIVIPPMNTTQCLSKKDAVPAAIDPKKNCKSPTSKVDGDTVTWQVECAGKDGSTTSSTGKAVYMGTTFRADVDVTTIKGGKTQKSAQKMTGKWIGDCKK